MEDGAFWQVGLRSAIDGWRCRLRLLERVEPVSEGDIKRLWVYADT
jgi:hypothetical protein